MKKSLSFNTWKTLLIFAVLLLSVLWLLQTVFFTGLYTGMRTRRIESSGDELAERIESGENLEFIEKEAAESGLAIFIIDRYGYIKYPSIILGSVTSRLKEDIFSQFSREMNEAIDVGRAVYQSEISGQNTIIYGRQLKFVGDELLYLYLSAKLDGLDQTTEILRSQLIWVTLISLLLAVAMSAYFSKRIAKPISELKMLSEHTDEEGLEHFDSDIEEINALGKAIGSGIKSIKATDRIRSDLYANVTHDFKTPITIIRSYAEMIRDFSGEEKAQRDEHIETIINECETLGAMVDGLLKTARVESEISSLKYENVDLSELFKSEIERLRALNPVVKIFEEISDGITANCDRSLMKKVVVNLLTNAVEHGCGSDVRVEVKRENGRSLFRVANGGRILPEKELAQVFNKFYTNSENHNRNSSGSGLGLYIVKLVLEAHRYEYKISSDADEGTVFEFCIAM